METFDKFCHQMGLTVRIKEEFAFYLYERKISYKNPKDRKVWDELYDNYISQLLT